MIQDRSNVRLRATTRFAPTIWMHAGRCLAGVAFLYLLNAFVQSGYVGPAVLILAIDSFGSGLLRGLWLGGW